MSETGEVPDIERAVLTYVAFVPIAKPGPSRLLSIALQTAHALALLLLSMSFLTRSASYFTGQGRMYARESQAGLIALPVVVIEELSNSTFRLLGISV